jgi:SAM-dependent methyltransferase
VSTNDLRQNKWDAKYREGKPAAAEPAAIVTELLPLLPRGVALDIACGTGRHALLLAKLGQTVTAVDASGVALDMAAKLAGESSLRVRRGCDFGESQPHSAALRLVQADLETTELPGDSFDLILCIHYLQRSLFAGIERALRPGGMLLFETFTRAQLGLAGGPQNPEFLPENRELRGAFPTLKTAMNTTACGGICNRRDRFVS